MVGTIRFIALALIAVSYLITRLRKKEEHKKKPASLDFSNYEKMKQDFILGRLILTTLLNASLKTRSDM